MIFQGRKGNESAFIYPPCQRYGAGESQPELHHSWGKLLEYLLVIFIFGNSSILTEKEHKSFSSPETAA